jgi:hypothetical protein
MKWEDEGKEKYEIYRYTHEKYRETKRKKSALTSEKWIPDKEYRKKDIYAKSYDSTKSCLEYPVE